MKRYPAGDLGQSVSNRTAGVQREAKLTVGEPAITVWVCHIVMHRALRLQLIAHHDISLCRLATSTMTTNHNLLHIGKKRLVVEILDHLIQDRKRADGLLVPGILINRTCNMSERSKLQTSAKLTIHPTTARPHQAITRRPMRRIRIPRISHSLIISIRKVRRHHLHIIQTHISPIACPKRGQQIRHVEIRISEFAMDEDDGAFDIGWRQALAEGAKRGVVDESGVFLVGVEDVEVGELGAIHVGQAVGDSAAAELLGVGEWEGAQGECRGEKGNLHCNERMM